MLYILLTFDSKKTAWAIPTLLVQSTDFILHFQLHNSQKEGKCFIFFVYKRQPKCWISVSVMICDFFWQICHSLFPHLRKLPGPKLTNNFYFIFKNDKMILSLEQLLVKIFVEIFRIVVTLIPDVAIVCPGGRWSQNARNYWVKGFTKVRIY